MFARISRHPPCRTSINHAGSSVKYSQKYSRQSSSMLHDALYQRTLEKKVQALSAAVKQGADINQKLNGKSPLYIVGHFYTYAEEFALLTETLFQLGAKVDYNEYQEGSPLHDVLFFVGSVKNKVDAIRIYTMNGVSVNHLNRQNSTPLDYALYFGSNKEGKDAIIPALLRRGAKHGHGSYSPCNVNSRWIHGEC